MREHLVHDICCSPAISNNGGSRGAVVAGFGAFRVVDDGGVAERKAACERKEIDIDSGNLDYCS